MNTPYSPSSASPSRGARPGIRAAGAQAIAAVTLACLLGPATASAQVAAATATEPAAQAAEPAAAPAGAPIEWSEGQVVRWDPRTSKVTLRHGPIKNLDMPPMTMVFVVKDTTQAAVITPGAKLRFHAEQQQGAYVLTRVEAAP